MLTHGAVWKAIDRLAARHGLSASALARRSGLDPTALNPSKRITADGRLRWPSTESLAKILAATGTAIADLFADIEVETEERVGGRRRDGGRLGDVFVVEAPGFPPLYRPGDRLIIEPCTIAHAGQRVLYRTGSGDVVLGEVLATGRQLVLANLGDATQTVAKPQELTFLARIIWVSQ